MNGLTIVHVLGSFEVGGGEQVALNLAAAQVREGHVVHIVSLSPGPDGPHAANFRSAGVQTHTLGKRLPLVDGWLMARLAWLFRQLRAEVVHTHNPLPLIYAGPAARVTNTPWIHTKHGFNAASPRRVGLTRRIGQFANAFVAVSQQTGEDALKRGDCRPERLTVIPNSIDLSRFAPNSETRQEVRRELGIASSAWVVGTVGRMSDVKNQELLIAAALPLLGESFQLVVVGDGPHRPKVEQALIGEPNARYVHLLGRRLDAPRLLTSFDTFALSSITEGLPLVLPEAMATGLPIVSTAVGGVPEVVEDGHTGWLVPSGDQLALREKLRWLHTHQDQAAVLGEKARQLALNRYPLKTMVDKYMGLYGKVCAKAAARAPLEG